MCKLAITAILAGVSVLSSLQGLPSCRGRQRWDHRCHRGLQLSKSTQITTNWKSPNASWCTHDVHMMYIWCTHGRFSEQWFKMVYTWHVLALSWIILRLQIIAGGRQVKSETARLYAAVYHRQARHCSRKASLRCSRCFVFTWFAQFGHLSLELSRTWKVLLCFVTRCYQSLGQTLFVCGSRQCTTEHLELSSCRQHPMKNDAMMPWHAIIKFQGNVMQCLCHPPKSVQDKCTKALVFPLPRFLGVANQMDRYSWLTLHGNWNGWFVDCAQGVNKICSWKVRRYKIWTCADRTATSSPDWTWRRWRSGRLSLFCQYAVVSLTSLLVNAES